MQKWSFACYFSDSKKKISRSCLTTRRLGGSMTPQTNSSQGNIHIALDLQNFDANTPKHLTGSGIFQTHLTKRSIGQSSDRNAREILTKNFPFAIFIADIIIGPHKLELLWCLLFGPAQIILPGTKGDFGRTNSARSEVVPNVCRQLSWATCWS